jgi:type II restriction enzyme
MKLNFEIKIAEGYKSPSQKVRVLTEKWVSDNIFCPNCGQINIQKMVNNKPVADFICVSCKEEFELKSKKTAIGEKIVDGAYRTMMERLSSNYNPNLFLLSYNFQTLEVQNFLVIPKHFFVPDIIEERRPLAATARRAGWVGCNILLHDIPQTGKIFFIRNRQIETKNKVLEEWKKTLFLRDEKENKEKGWLLDIINCIEKLSMRNFTLGDIYSFESMLSEKHPGNKHIKDKIRQQLQILRDKGYLEFAGQGRYHLQ